jgi:hypothetical protein
MVRKRQKYTPKDNEFSSCISLDLGTQTAVQNDEKESVHEQRIPFV